MDSYFGIKFSFQWVFNYSQFNQMAPTLARRSQMRVWTGFNFATMRPSSRRENQPYGLFFHTLSYQNILTN